MSDVTTPIAAPVHALLDLFARELSAVRFPDVDRDVLAEGAARVEEAALAVVAAELALAAARTALTEAQDNLHGRAQRALSYARVFADGNPDLRAQLDAIALPRATAAIRPDGTAPKKRGRPRKTPEPVPAARAAE